MTALLAIEDGGWFSRRAIWWMILGGVFERHPGLKLVITEAPGVWWPYLLQELDSIWDASSENPAFLQRVPSKPSEYIRRNVFIGGSFMSRMEAEAASADGFYRQLMWGSDYPHFEGTWQYPMEGETDPITHLALRNTFSNVPSEHVTSMLGDTKIEVYGLDRAKLREVATRIGAPTLEDLAVPIRETPARGSKQAFRQKGTWL